MVFKVKNIIAFNVSTCCLFQDSFIYNNSHLKFFIINLILQLKIINATLP